MNQSSQIQASRRSMGIFAVVSNHCLPGSKERSHQEFLSPTKPFLQKEGYWGRAPDRNYTVSRLLVLRKQEACQGWPSPEPLTFSWTNDLLLDQWPSPICLFSLSQQFILPGFCLFFKMFLLFFENSRQFILISFPSLECLPDPPLLPAHPTSCSFSLKKKTSHGV